MSDISSGVRPFGFTLFLIDSQQLALLTGSIFTCKEYIFVSVICYTWYYLPRWHSGKESACQCKEHRRHGFSPWVGKIPWRRKWQLTPVILAWEIPWTEEPGWVHKESGTVEQLSTHRHIHGISNPVSMPRLICAGFHWPVTTRVKSFYINGGGFVLTHHTYSLIDHWKKNFFLIWIG